MVIMTLTEITLNDKKAQYKYFNLKKNTRA